MSPTGGTYFIFGMNAPLIVPVGNHIKAVLEAPHRISLANVKGFPALQGSLGQSTAKRDGAERHGHIFSHVSAGELISDHCLESVEQQSQC